MSISPTLPSLSELSRQTSPSETAHIPVSEQVHLALYCVGSPPPLLLCLRSALVDLSPQTQQTILAALHFL